MKTLLVLCILFRVQANLDTQPASKPDGPHHHPIYRYSCNEDMSVTFKGVSGVVRYFNSTTSPGQQNNCTISSIEGHNGNFKISQGCLYIDPNNTNNRIVYLSVFDGNENETAPTTSTAAPTTSILAPTSTAAPTTSIAATNAAESQTPALIAAPSVAPVEVSNALTATPILPIAVLGGHIFKLTCINIPDEGVIRYALAETGVKDFEQMHEVYNEVKDVDMRFKEGSDINLPDVSEVYIGDMFYMYIKYMGSQPYDLLPVKCSAYKGTFRLTETENTIDLWDDSQKPCLTATAKNFKLMENFERLYKTVVYAKLYGFRLADHLTGDPNGDDLTISCKVKICNGCTNKNDCEITEAIGRTKRYTDVPGTFHTVYRTISVKDKALISNDADSHNGSRTLATVALLALVIEMNF